MKRLILITIALAFGFLLASAAWYYTNVKTGKPHTTRHILPTAAIANRLHQQSGRLLQYARQHGYNTHTCFLIDMSIASGKNRFFVYDLQKDSVLDAGLVAHGCCNKEWLSGRKYGNEIGCGCTSLGKYKIGGAYKGRFGTSYKLIGLDSTNSNAYNRFVVLHPYSAVPDNEVDPYPICQSNGCPMVSPAFMNKLAGIINASPRPLLLHIFDSDLQ